MAKTKKKLLIQTFKKLLFRACLFKKIIWWNLGIICIFKIQIIRWAFEIENDVYVLVVFNGLYD